jgi:hypothetical protein
VHADDRDRLLAYLLRELELDAGSPVRPDPGFVAAAFSVMVRRTFSDGGDPRAVTAYVKDVIGHAGDGAPRRARLAEGLIRSELGELELLGAPPGNQETLHIARTVLVDLCRRASLDAAQVHRLAERAAREAGAMRDFTAANRLGSRKLLARALARRSGRSAPGGRRGHD